MRGNNKERASKFITSLDANNPYHGGAIYHDHEKGREPQKYFNAIVI